MPGRALIVVAVVGVALVVAPVARADHAPGHARIFRLEAPVPCLAACPFAETKLPRLAFKRRPFDACTSPGPPGSFDDLGIKTPDGVNRLTVELFPTIDWDLFICVVTTDGATGRMVARSGDPSLSPYRCDSLLSSSPPIGCTERVRIAVAPGSNFLIRGYNVADFNPAIGRFAYDVSVDKA